MPDGSGKNQGQGNGGRSPEILHEAKPDTGLLAFREAAEKIEKDPNFEAAEKIRRLNGRAERMTQLDEISAMTTGLISVMAKLEKKEKGTLDKIRKNPALLQQELMTKGLVASLSLPEHTALKELPRILGEGGDTSHYFKIAWGDIVDQAQTAAGGWTEKLRNQIKKDPVGTIGLMAVGVGVVWMGWNLISKLWKDKEAEKAGGADGQKAGTEADKNSWLKKKILIPIGIMIAGAILGKDKLQRLLAGLGIEDLQKLLMSGQSIPEDIRKQIEEQKNRILQLEEAAKQKVTAAGAAVAGAVEKAKEGVEEVAEKAKEEAEKKENQFEVSTRLFLRLYFYQREFESPDMKNNLGNVIFQLKETDLKKLKSVFDQYRDKKAIPSEAFGITRKIDDKHLFMLIGNILEVQKYLEISDTEKVGSLFEHMLKDPVHKINDVINEEVLNKLEKFDVYGAISAVDLQKISASVKENYDLFIDKINKNLKFDVDLAPEQKKVFREIQIALVANENLKTDAKTAVRETIARRGLESKADAVIIEKSEKFFDDIKTKTAELLPNLYECFQITELGGIEIENDLKNGLNVENMSFSQAIELIAVSEGINWKAGETAKIHWMKDLALLNIIIRCLPPAYRNRYTTALTKKFIESDDFEIKIPSLAALLPYLDRLKGFAIRKGMDYGLNTMEKAAYYRDTKPTESKDFAERAKKSPVTSWGLEAAGGTIEMGTDAAALLISSLPILKKELASVETGEDFLHLISHKITKRNDGSSIMYDINNPGSVIINIGWKYLVAKPTGILKESLGAVVDGDFGGAAKIWLVGTAPFVVIGGIKGGAERSVFTLSRLGRTKAILAGMGKGLAYPAYAHYFVTKAGVKTVKGITTAGIALQEYAGRPGMYAGEVFRWTAERLKYTSIWPGQNIQSLMNNGEIFTHYWEAAGKAVGYSYKELWEKIKVDKTIILRRFAGNFNEEMALRYARRFATRYNDFFLFGSDAGRLLAGTINNNTIGEAIGAYDRFKNFMRVFPSRQYQDVFGRVGKMIEAGYSKEKIIEEFSAILKHNAVFDLSQEEAKALAKQVTTKQDLELFMSRMKEGQQFYQSKIRKPEIISYKTTEDLFKGSRGELQTKLTTLEADAKQLAGAEKVAAMQEIHALDSFMNPTKQPKLAGYEQLATDEAKANRLTEFASEIEARSAGVDAYVKREVQAIQELAKEQKLSLAHPDIQKEFIELDKFMENYTKERAGALNELSKNYKELPKNIRAPELKAKIKFAFEGPEGTFVTKMKIAGKKALIGRAKIGAIIASGIFAIEYFTNKDPEKELFKMLEEFGPTAGQILVDILPFVGTGSMLYGAVSGKETVTGAKLDVSGRLVTGAFGIASLAADALTVLSAGWGGVPATAARLAVLAEKGGRVGKAAEMMLKNWSRISSLMTRMGPKVFGESVLSFMKGEKAIKGVQLAEKTATIAGGGIMAGSLVYSFVGGHEVDIPEDIDIGSKPAPDGAKESVPEKEPEKEPVAQAA
jgi:hypothetical protein